MKNIFVLSFLFLLLLPVSCFASGHLNGLEGADEALAIIAFILLLGILNFISFIVVLTRPAIVLLSICLILNCILLLYATAIYSKDHNEYIISMRHYGRDKQMSDIFLKTFKHRRGQDFKFIFVVAAIALFDIVYIYRTRKAITKADIADTLKR